MEGVFNSTGTKLIQFHQEFINFLPFYLGDFFNLLALVFLVALYSVFIWNFYKFISKKNIIELNLNKYNTSEHPLLAKFLAGFFYFLEYIIILPFLIFFWFGVFTLFLIFLNESLDLSGILIVSATIITAIRITSYYKEELAKDLAKLLPFTLLAISILNPKFFNIERIFSNFSEIPNFFSKIIIYLLFIIVIEIILRFFSFIFSLIGTNQPEIEEKK